MSSQTEGDGCWGRRWRGEEGALVVVEDWGGGVEESGSRGDGGRDCSEGEWDSAEVPIAFYLSGLS